MIQLSRRPYGDRGHWVYTDYGWYWDSDYSWGMTFHYGRWFHHARFGWCWYQDTEWEPYWETRRSGGDYCGWAPLPPFAVFRPGVGFFYRGANVAVDFDFGLDADCFLFVSPDHFCDRHPRSFCVAQQYVPQIFHRTTVINNYNINNTTIVNRGFGVERIAGVTHRPIEAVHISSLPNAGRQGWHGDNFQRAQQHAGVGNNNHTTVMNNNNSGHTFTPGNVDKGQAQNGQDHFSAVNNTPSATRFDNAGHAMPGIQPGGYKAGAYQPEVQNRLQPGGTDRVQSQNTFSQQQQQQQLQPARSRQLDTYGAADRVTSQNTQIEQTQARTYDNAPPIGAMQQHGAEQLQQHENLTPPLPRDDGREKFVEAGGHNAGQPVVQGQSQVQAHNPGNGTSSGANNNNAGNGPNNGGRNSDKGQH